MKHTSPFSVSLLLAFWVASSGCVGAPGTSPTYQVVAVSRVGPLIESQLDWTSKLAPVSSDSRITALFPAGGACEQILMVGNEADYLTTGMTGTLRRGDESCASVGIANLTEWRDRRPRPISGSAVPRAQAKYRVVFRDAGMAILRGRFPLANKIGWAGGEDTLTLIPSEGVCAPLLERSVASIEYRPSGRTAVSLVTGQGQCAITGFARPVPELGLD